MNHIARFLLLSLCMALGVQAADSPTSVKPPRPPGYQEPVAPPPAEPQPEPEVVIPPQPDGQTATPVEPDQAAAEKEARQAEAKKRAEAAGKVIGSAFLFFGLLVLFLWVLPTLIPGLIASNKGHSFILFTFLALLLSWPLMSLIALLMPYHPSKLRDHGRG